MLIGHLTEDKEEDPITGVMLLREDAELTKIGRVSKRGKINPITSGGHSRNYRERYKEQMDDGPIITDRDFWV